MPFSFLTAQGRARKAALGHAREAGNRLYRLRRHEWDRLAPETLAEARALEARLAMRPASEAEVAALEAAAREADEFVLHHQPPERRGALRENVEVFVVAVVLALAVRAYFVQPFKIPTGSMEPTLMGIAARPLEGPKPGLLRRMYELVLFGRSYHELRTPEGGLVTALRPGHVFTWWEYTDLDIGERTYRVWINPQVLMQKLDVTPGKYYAPGEWVVRAVTEAGDQILVNKMAYHFRGPRRGEVFVFKTTGIPMLEERLQAEGVQGSQYYIKRCSALGGDTVKIEPPRLFINGQLASTAGARRVMSARDGYGGYQLADMPGTFISTSNAVPLPAGTALALGDNSRASFDSRYWGPVPRANTAGVATFVYWPFGPRWGWVR